MFATLCQVGCAKVVGVLLIIFTSLVLYMKWTFGYWKRKNLPQLEGTIPFGSLENPLTRKHSLGVWMQKLYKEIRSRGWKHAGLYFTIRPQYMVVDPELVKRVMQVDFNYFTDRGIYYNEKHDPLSAHLFNVGGHRWRNLRTKLTPTFTSGKMKMMFETLVRCSEQMKEAMDGYEANHEAIDIKDVLARFTTDIIGSCAFGLECNSFKSTSSEFRYHGKRIFEPIPKFRALLYSFIMARPSLAQKLGITFVPKETTQFFLNVIKDTVNYRKSNNIVRNDMLQVMMDLKGSTDEDGKVKSLTIEEIAAQAFVFFIAGFETSSTTMTFCLFELATNPDIQNKVREEINRVLAKHDGKITYEALADMKYMTQVIDETLRKYPPLPFVPRECVKDYQVPGTEGVIEKGTRVIIPILGLHHDPEYYPDPEKFDPERFNEENKKNIRPFTYLPFGEGPRNCIGLRFGMMQTKVGLTVLLKNYEIFLNKQTKVPLEINRFNFILTTYGGIWLDLKKIQ